MGLQINNVRGRVYALPLELPIADLLFLADAWVYFCFTANLIKPILSKSFLLRGLAGVLRSIGGYWYGLQNQPAFDELVRLCGVELCRRLKQGRAEQQSESKTTKPDTE